MCLSDSNARLNASLMPEPIRRAELSALNRLIDRLAYWTVWILQYSRLLGPYASSRHVPRNAINLFRN
jgi:hypothetical protein